MNPEDTKKLKWLLNNLQKAEDYARPYFDRAKRHYKLYRFGSAVSQEDWPYINLTRTKDIFAFVEDSTATLMQALMGQYPFYGVMPRLQSLLEMQMGVDSVKIAKQLELVLNYQVAHEDAEFLEELLDCFKGAGIYGNGYMGVYPRFEGRDYVGPLFKAIDFWDVLPIPGARRLSKARGLFIREFMSKDEATDLARKFGLKGGVENLTAFMHGSEADKKWHPQLLQEIGMETYAPSEDDIEILHYFSGGHVISIANRGIIIRDSRVPVQNQLGRQQVVKPFPYDLPQVQYKFIPIPLEYFALGIPEVLEVLQEDKNLIRSARRDNIDLVINKIVKARTGADVNFDLIKYYPGAIWPMEHLDDVMPVDQADVTQSSYLEEDKLRFDMENALTMFGYARGQTPAHTEQPTTVIKLQQASQNRLDLGIKLAEFTILQDIAARVVLLTRKYMPQQTYEAIIGEKDAGFYRLSEEQIKMFYMLKPLGSSVTHIKEIRQQQIASAIGVLEKVAPVSMNGVEPFNVNVYQATRTALEALDMKNIESLIPKVPPQQAQQIIQQSEMKEMAKIAYGEDAKYTAKAKGEIAVVKEKAKHERKE